MTTAEAPEPWETQWAKEIGQFVMAFGSIEGSTYTALRKLPRDSVGQSLIDANLPLAPRLDVLVALAADREGMRWERFRKVLARIKTLAGKRNLIAHNGVGLDVFIDASGQYSLVPVISNAKKPPAEGKFTERDRMAFESLVKHRKEAQLLDGELNHALMEVVQLADAERRGDLAAIAEIKDKFIDLPPGARFIVE